MLKWIQQYRKADRETKWFIITTVLFGLAIILSTLYAYGRLEVAHSEKAVNQQFP